MRDLYRTGQEENEPADKLAHMERAVILEGARTPIGRFLGSFAETPAVQLGELAAVEALRLAQDDIKAGRSPDVHLDAALKELNSLKGLGLKDPANNQKIEAARQGIATARPPVPVR